MGLAWCGQPRVEGGRLCVAKVHKFAVIDVESDDPVVILGSYNWMDRGVYDNDEDTLIVHDRRLTPACHAERQRVWSALGGETLCQRCAVSCLCL